MTNNSSGSLTGITISNNAGEINLDGKTTINIKGNSGSIVGIRNMNDGGKIEFKDSLNMTISNGTTTEKSEQGYHGIRVNKSTTTFGGNTNITMTDNTSVSNSISSIADVLSDTNDSIDTVVNFNGAENVLTLNSVGTGKNVLYGIRASGNEAIVNFTGKSTTINITSENASKIVGLGSQYAGNIVSNTGTKLSINTTSNSTDTNSFAVGIMTETYGGEGNHHNGNANLNGSVDITSSANVGTAYGILNQTSTMERDLT